MTQRVRAHRIAVAAAALVLLAACGDDNDTGTDTRTAPSPVATAAASPPSGSPAASEEPTASADPSVAADATTIQVDMSEFLLRLDRTTLPAGTYTFLATNVGSVPHALQIDGPGVENQGTGTVQPGDDGTVTVTLSKGTYTVYCPIPGHEDKGMKQEVTVS